jgi:hypothetical protein
MAYTHTHTTPLFPASIDGISHAIAFHLAGIDEGDWPPTPAEKLHRKLQILTSIADNVSAFIRLAVTPRGLVHPIEDEHAFYLLGVLERQRAALQPHIAAARQRPYC